jgi:hypothetical protein
MNTINTIVHAYKQAPWRIQRQWVSTALLAIIGLALVATLYLMVTSQAGIVGREIQYLRDETTASRRSIADLQTELAQLTSQKEIEQRASALGFRTVQPNELEYLIVPGYSANRGPARSDAREPQPSLPNAPIEYRQSLLEWIDEQMQTTGKGN